jgi:hypothetical protein
MALWLPIRHALRQRDSGTRRACKLSTASRFGCYIGGSMDLEQRIAEIEWLERMFEAPDIRPLTPDDVAAANRSHDAKLANSPWFRLWQNYGVCCRPSPPVLRFGESDR